MKKTVAFLFYISCLFLLLYSYSGQSQVSIEFKIKPGSSNTLNGNIVICNNSGASLPAGYYQDFYMPNFNIKDLSSSPGTVQIPSPGVLRFKFATWMLPTNGQCKSISVNSTSTYTNPFLFPPYGIDSNGDTVKVVVTDPQFIPKAGQAEPKEFYIQKECFISSPSKLCLGEAQIQEWNRTADVRVPSNRKGWALAAAHAHRLFTNMVGCEVTSINFAFATSMIEGRMGCDASFTPPAGDDNPLTYESHITTDGCFQIRPLGYVQVQDFYPNLFKNTPKASLTDGGNFITSCLTKTLYDYTSLVFWDQYWCYDSPREFLCNMQDPYGGDAMFAYMYHKGWNHPDFQSVFGVNRNTWVNSNNIADLLAKTYPGIDAGYAERVRNNIIRLENNYSVPGGPSLNMQYAIENWEPAVHEYHGCYNEAFTWQEISNYIDEALRVFITADANKVKTAAKAAFDAINGGAAVNFEDLGAVIDQIVLSIPVPSADQGMSGKYFSQAEQCIKPEIRIESYDQICSGQEAELLVYLMGTPPFSYSIQTPSGGMITRNGINVPTDYVKVNQPGEYKIVAMSDANGSLDLKCNVARTTIENAGNAGVSWNKASATSGGCINGAVELLLTGTGPWVITYAVDGGSDQVLNVPANSSSPYLLDANPSGQQYVLKHLLAGGCDVDLNEALEICNTTCTPPAYYLSSNDIRFCQGDTALLTLNFNGVAPHSIYFKVGAIPLSATGIMTNTYSIPVFSPLSIQIDSVKDATCLNDTVKKINVQTYALPVLNLGNDTTVCTSDYTLTVANNFNSYEWNGSSFLNTNSYTATSSGTVVLAVENANGCVASDSVEVLFSNDFSVDLGTDSSLCAEAFPFNLDASNTVSLSGSSAGLSYFWEDGSTSAIKVISGPGTYHLTVRIGNCSQRDTVVFSALPSPALNLGSDTVMCAENFLLKAGTFDSYQWNGQLSNNTSELLVTQTSLNTIIVKDDNGCSAYDTINVILNSPEPVFLSADTSICISDLPFTVSTLNNPSGNLVWQDGSTGNTFLAQSGGIISVENRNGNCVSRDTLQLTVTPGKVLDLGNDTAICGIQFILNAGNEFSSYVWNGQQGTAQLAVTTSGKYVLQATTSTNCVSKDSIIVQLNPNPQIDLGADTSICMGINQGILLEPGAGFSSYLWSTGSTNATEFVTIPGTYEVEVIDQNGCEANDTIVIDEVLPLSFDLGTNITICPNSPVVVNVPTTVTANTNATWYWSQGNNSSSISYTGFTDGQDTTLFLTVLSKEGCPSIDSLNILIRNELVVSGLKDTSICAGQSLTLKTNYAGQMGYQYTWQDGSGGQNYPVISAAEGTQKIAVEVLSNQGCSGRDSMWLTVHPLPRPVLNNAEICQGDQLTLNHGLLSVQSLWNDAGQTTPSIIVSPLTSTNYQVKVTDVNGCENTAVANINVNALPIVSLGNPAQVCQGDSVLLNTGLNPSNYSFEWRFDGRILGENRSILSATETGKYEVLVQNLLTQCQQKEELELVFTPAPIAAISDSVLSICEGQSVTISNAVNDPNYTYYWSNGSIEHATEVNSSGLVSVIVSNGFCSASDEVLVFTHPIPGTALFNDTVVCFEEMVNGTLELNTGIFRGKHLWNTGDTSRFIRVEERGIYEVTITNEWGCIGSASVKVEEDCQANVWIPDGFTPNDDGMNDLWRVEGRGIEEIEVLIFNRWGELIWKSYSKEAGWDGTYQNNPVAQDVYIYKMNFDYFNSSGQRKNKARVGTITLVR